MCIRDSNIPLGLAALVIGHQLLPHNPASDVKHKFDRISAIAVSYTHLGNRHDPYSDIGMVNAQGGKIINLTKSGYTSGSPRWVLDGNAILFITERYGMRAHASSPDIQV